MIPPNYPVTGYYWNAYSRTLAYRAQISGASRTYVDSGVAVLSADLYDIFTASGQLAGEGIRFHASFRSSQVSVQDQFASQAALVSHEADIPLSTPTVRITLRWERARDSFRLTNVRLAPTSKRTLAKVKPGKLRITKLRITVLRTKTSLTATVSKLRPGKLSFTVQPQLLAGATSVQTAVSAPGA